MVDVEEELDQLNGPDDNNEVVTENAAFSRAEPPQDDKRPPKVDSKLEVLHEKVKKQLIKEGHGQKPAKFSTCFLHYRAWVENTEHKFEDTWLEQRPIELVIGKEKNEMAGLGIGLSSMKSGERALLHVGWELGYGKEGSFSFPNVPPEANLVYEVELIGFDEAKEGKARSDMTVEENIQAADTRKMRGNDYFKDEKLEEAMQQYEMVLSEDENNVKALFRRGKARAELGQIEAAREDFQKAKKFAPEDKAIIKELRLLAEHDKAVYQKQKEIYKGIFGPRPEPKPERQLSRLTRLWQWLISLVCSLCRIRRVVKAD